MERRFVVNMMIRVLSSFLVLLLLAGICLAGNTGKIVGKVTDDKGEPLPGVIVKVLTTTRGAVTDPDGRYTIIGVPVGTYNVEASLISYGKKNDLVKVAPDVTSTVDFVLSAGSVDMPEVIVKANKNMVNTLTTTSEKTIDTKQIDAIPNVKDVKDVVAIQAGVVKMGSNMFLRGGRGNEVQYVVDGVPSNDVVGGSAVANPNAQLQNFFASQSAGVVGGGGGLSVSANAIQSVSVQTSGFDADQGNAQSGVISITTKSGSDNYSGSAQFRTDKVSSQNQNESYSSFSFGGPEPVSKYLLSGMGINVPGALTFFVSADMDRNDGTSNFVHNAFYNPLERKAQLNGFLGGLLNGLGFRFRENQSNSFSLNTKLRYDPSSSDQFTYGYRASISSHHDYNPFWAYRADSSLLRASLATQHVLTLSHFFGSASFLKLTMGKLETHDGNDVAGIYPPDYSPVTENQDVQRNGFGYLGMDQTWSTSLVRRWSARVDFNSQVHPLHLLKAGMEFYYEELNSTQIQNPTVPDRDTVGNDLFHGAWPGYGQYRWNLNNYPNQGAAYVQDNIEFSGLVFHIGLRYDYLDIGHQVFYDDFIRAWNRVVQAGNSTLHSDWATLVPDGNSFKYYALHGYMSPRLSIGYPVTDRIGFHFNYGHFYQFPDRKEYFLDPFIEKKDNTIGNPSLKPEKTVQYEAGFEDQFTDEMAFTVSAFYKDIFDLTSTAKILTENVYTNLDYASARGFEITFRQELANNLSTNLSYSYQIAKGRASNPLANIFNPLLQLPRETRLDWDQNHTVNLVASYKVSPREEGTFFGLPFVNNYGISFTFNYGSGYPYTPDHGQRQDARTVYLVNNETRPYTSTVNLSFYKGFILFDKMNLTATLDITNLLNRKNIAVGSTGLGFNQDTGLPNQFGDVTPSASSAVAPKIIAYRYTDSRTPPYTFDPPRQILLGFKLGWN